MKPITKESIDTDYEKIERVIESCTNLSHIVVTNRMIDAYEKKHSKTINKPFHGIPVSMNLLNLRALLMFKLQNIN